MTKLWHGFAPMATVRDREFVLHDGEGAWVSASDGRRYLDSTASLWYCNVGHGRLELADAGREQMARLAAYSTFGAYATQPALDLAEKLSEIAPIEDAVVFFTCDGSEAVDTAVKLARRYWTARGAPERRLFVAQGHAYHGMNVMGTALQGIDVNREGYGEELVSAIHHLPVHDSGALEEFLEAASGEVAAVIAEPIIGAGGVIEPPADWWPAVESVCRRHDVLLIADEVITGFGRLGTWWGCERFGVVPDLVTFAKGVTSGYVPLGGVLVNGRVQEPFWTGDAVFRHGYTYSGHATAAAVGLANLALVESEDLLPRVQALEPVLRDALHGVAHETVAEVRAVGLTGAIEFSAEALADDPGLPERAVLAARELGVLTRVLRGVALQISPPFVITEDEIRLLARRLGDGIALAADRSHARA